MPQTSPPVLAYQTPNPGEEVGKVNDKASWYLDQSPDWERSDHLMAGTSAMRAAGDRYLTQFELEGNKAFSARLKATVLTNFYKDHYHTAMGLIFAEDIEIKDSKIPQDQLDNIDNQGHSIQAYAERMASKLLLKGLHHVMVDMPPIPEAGADTAEDDKRLGLRPYWVSLGVERLFNAYCEVKNNIRDITQIRFTEEKTVVKGFDRSVSKAIKVYYDDAESPEGKVRFETWIADKGGEYKLSVDPKDIGEMGIDEIPLVTYATSDEDFMCSPSVMIDIAHKNVEHWQSSSDQRNILTVSRYPVQYQIGTAAAIVDMGPTGILHSEGTSTPKQNVEFGYIEPAGTGVAAGERDLDRIIQDANVLSIRLRTTTGDRTATGDALDFTMASSPLHMVAQALENGLNACLKLHAKWLGLDEKAAGTVKVSKDFGISASEAARILEIGTARRAGDIDLETYIAEMKQIGVFKTDVQAEKVRQRIIAEGTGMFADPKPADPVIPPKTKTGAKPAAKA